VDGEPFSFFVGFNVLLSSNAIHGKIQLAGYVPDKAQIKPKPEAGRQ